MKYTICCANTFSTTMGPNCKCNDEKHSTRICVNFFGGAIDLMAIALAYKQKLLDVCKYAKVGDHKK